MKQDRVYALLLVEDEPGDAGLIRNALRDKRFGSFDLVWVTSMAEARGKLTESVFDIVLLDLSLPDSTGKDTVRAGLEAAGKVPVVILTGQDDADLALELMALGVQDYLVKGSLYDDILIRALRHAISRSRADLALRESRDKFQSLVANIPGVTFRCKADKSWTMLFMSDQVLDLTGFPARDFVDNSMLAYADIIHEEDVALVEDVVNKAVDCGNAWEIEYRVRHKDGSVRWVSEKGIGVRDALGKTVFLDGFILDITDRKQIEAALLHQKAHFESLYVNTNDAMVFFDTEHRIINVNEMFSKMFGYALDEVLYKNINTVVDPLKKSHEYGSPRILRGEQIEMDAVRYTKAGEAVNVLLKGGPVSEKGHIVGGYAIYADITERKQAEEKLRLFAEQMEIKNLELDQALTKAEAATRAKSEFLANMSHEIRTPMNGVIGMTGLLLDTELDETQRRYAETVRSSGQTLLALINDILDFSKIESGKLELETLDFSLRSMLDDFAAMMAVKAGEKNLEFICAADPDVPDRLSGDPGRLRQILTNLAGNAVKFTGQGEVVVKVALVHGSRFNGSTVEGEEVHGSRFNGSTVEETEDGGNGVGAKNLSHDGVALHLTDTRATPPPTVNPEPLNREPRTVELCFTIRDTGIGIPKDKQHMLFDKFSQVDSSITRQFGGTGLGLAISRQLAGLMGGEVGVQSEEGQGATFWFTVSLHQADHHSLEELHPGDLRGVHALVVDDNATNREILQTRLASWGMRVDQAADGPSALGLLYKKMDAGDPFGLAILDMQMPGMDGEALGRAIRADDQLGGVCLIMMTSMGMRGDARRFQDIGFQGYLEKPVPHADLQQCIVGALRRTDPGLSVAGKTAERAARRTVPDFSGRKVRVLLVEDNITNQQVALAMLQNLGISADAAANGAEALKALETMPYDLVLMDVQMPVMDGLEATRRIRAAEVHGSRFSGSAVSEEMKRDVDVGATRGRPMVAAPDEPIPDSTTPPTVNREPLNREPSITVNREPGTVNRDRRTPIIALTAHAMQGDRERFLEAGMDDYLAKPLEPDKLVAVLEKWIRVANGREAGHAETGTGSGTRPGTEAGAQAGATQAGRIPLPDQVGPPVFDRAGMYRRMMDDQDLVKSILGIFLGNLPIQLERIKASLDADDYQGVFENTHAIKGSSGNVGGNALRAAALSMEEAVKAGDAASMQVIFSELERQCELLKAALQEEVKIVEGGGMK